MKYEVFVLFVLLVTRSKEKVLPGILPGQTTGREGFL